MDDINTPGPVTGPADWIMADRQRATSWALDGLRQSPDDAARASEIAKFTGDNPVLVQHDLEGYEHQHKAAITSFLLNNNQHLREYANSDPMHARLSSDDWGQLDATSNALLKLRRGTILGEAFKAGKDAYGEEPLGIKFTPKDWEAINSNPGYKLLASAMELVGQPVDAFMRSLTAFTAAGAKGAGETWAHLTGDEGAGRRVEKAIGETVELGMIHGMAVHGPSVPAEFNAIANKAAKAVEAAVPYIKAGIEPPVGVHPIIDQLKVEQTRLDIKALDEVLSESTKSTTRERSQEAFATFVRSHPEFNVHISADAVRRLYGDKEPSPEDGILGWVPGVVSDLRAAEAGGGDVTIPIADWLAKVEPEVAKELHDDIKLRPGGVTVNEWKELVEHKARRAEIEEPKVEGAEEVEPQPKTPVEALRDHAALQPITETLQGRWEKLSRETEVYRPTERWNEAEQSIVDDLNAEIKRIAPQAAMRVFGGIRDPQTKRSFGGSWEPHPGDKVNVQPLIAISINAKDPLKTTRHEAMHDLWERGFWSNDEKVALLKAALKEGWIEEHNIDKRYTQADQYTKLKEAIADQFGKWRSSRIEPTSLAGKALQKLTDLVDSIKAILQKHGIGRTTWEELFERADRGAVGKRKEGSGVEAGALRSEEVTKLNDPQTIAEHFEKLHGTDLAIQRAQEISGWLKAKGRGDEAGPYDQVVNILRNKDNIVSFKRPMRAEPELPGTRNLEDTALFEKANAIGMTVPQYKKYTKLIEQRTAEDLEFQQGQAEKVARKRLSKEWKERENEVRKEARTDVEARPDIAVDEFFRNGYLYGEKLSSIPKLDHKAMSAEQRAALPERYLRDNGIHPDDAAGLFGYQSGRDLLDRLAGLNRSREEAGLKPKEYLDRLVEEETDRRMQKEFGDFDAKVLEEAKDHVISPTQMDMIAEEMLALGMRAHGSISITKDAVKKWVKESFDQAKVTSHSVDKYLAQAGKAGRAAEMGLLSGKPADAFKAKQQQYISMLLANESKKLEKAQDRFEGTMKRLSKREISSQPEVYTTFVHDIMMNKIGRFVQRSVQDLGDAIGRSGYKDLEGFVESKTQYEGLDMPVSDFLYDPKYKKTTDEMSTAEFVAVHNSIKTMLKNGREERKFNVQQDKVDLREFIDNEIIPSIERLPPHVHEAKESKLGALGNLLKTFYWSHITPESIFNRWAMGDKRSPLRKTLQDMIDAGEYKQILLKKVQTTYAKEVKGIKDPYEKVSNNLFHDPDEAKYSVQNPIPFTRQHGLMVLANVGNPSNLAKLAAGYGIKPEQALDWAVRNMRKPDWDWMQKFHDKILSPLKREADRNAENASDVPAMNVPLEPIVIPPGVNPEFPNGATYKGWYFPILKHEVWEGKIPVGKMAIESEYYTRAATARNYEKARTGHIAPLSFDFGRIESHLNEVAHDIAFRSPVRELAKIFRDETFSRAVRRHYSPIVMDNLRDWLIAVSNSAVSQSKSAATANKWIGFARTNIIGNLIHFNPYTVQKHFFSALSNSMGEVGSLEFVKATASLLSADPITGERNWKFAMENFDEIKRRHQVAMYTISGLEQKTVSANTLRDTISYYGSAPVAISDMISAVPTGLAAYAKTMKETGDEGMAKQDANRAIRRAHGSTAITNRPLIMLGGPIAQQYTSLYTFFNTMANRHFEIAWRAREGNRAASEGKFNEAWGQYAKHVVPYVVASVIIPTLVEEWVTGQLDEKKHGLLQKGALFAARAAMAPYIGLRDLIYGLETGRETVPGIFAGGVKEIGNMIRSLSATAREGLNKKTAAKMIETIPSATGTVFGIGAKHLGLAGAGAFRAVTGQEKPKGLGDVGRLLAKGTLKEPRQ